MRSQPRPWLRAAAAAAAAFAAAAVLSIAVPAQAATSFDPARPTHLTSTTAARSCTNTAINWCAPFHYLSNGTQVEMVCYRDDSWATGWYASQRWFLIRVRGTTFEALVHSSLVANQYTSPACSTIKRVRMGLEAIARMGQVYASSADGPLFSNSSWGYPLWEWSGDCKKLASIAHYRATGGQYLVSGNAKPTFDWYWANRSNKGTSTTPPYGALVGYNIAAPYGHIAVAVGGSRVASTRGLDAARLSNQVLPLSTYGNYLGWVVP